MTPDRNTHAAFEISDLFDSGGGRGAPGVRVSDSQPSSPRRSEGQAKLSLDVLTSAQLKSN